MAELYEFSDSMEFFRFSPSILDKSFGGETYTATNIKRSEIQITKALLKSQVSFTFPKSHSFAAKVLNEVRDKSLEVTIYKDSLVFWSGRVVSAKLSSTSVQVTCDNSENAETQTANGARFSYQCWKGVYDDNCTLVRADWEQSFSTTTVLDSVEVPISDLTAHEFDNGIAIMSGQERRILRNSTTTVVLVYPFTGVLTGTILLAPGCDLSKTNCQKFNNLVNFGGFPWIPVKNPMDRVGLI